MKLKYIFISFFIIYANQLYCMPINIEGKIYRVLDNGEEVAFPNIRIDIRNTGIHAITNTEGYFRLSEKSSNLEAGEKIELYINDYDWFMLSPFSGIMNVPRYSEYMKIRVIPKRSRFHSSLLETIRDYSVQVVTTYNEGKAIDIMKQLIKDGYKNVYYESHLRSNIPKNGYFYKVKVGKFKVKKNAEDVMHKIRRNYTKMKDSFISVHTVIKKE